MFVMSHDPKKWGRIQHIRVEICEKCGRKFLPVKDKGCVLCYYGITDTQLMRSFADDMIIDFKIID